MEDDVLTQSEIVVDPSWECAGHYYPESGMDGKNWYGAGGRSVFKVNTFLDNFHKIYDFIDDDFDKIVC